MFTLGLTLGILAAVFLIITFLAYILISLTFVICMTLLVIFIFIAVFTLVFLVAIPYYAVTKKPEVQYGGGYKLESVKDKDDEKRTNNEPKK
jgi:hypothetical protein